MSSKKKSPTVRKNNLEKELAAARAENLRYEDKIKDMRAQFNNAILPFQKIALYLFTFTVFSLGLATIVYAAAHPDMNLVTATRDNMYITGTFLLAIGLISYFLGRYLLQSLEKNNNLFT